MIMKETNTILSAIITASEKMQGSKLEDSALKEIVDAVIGSNESQKLIENLKK